MIYALQIFGTFRTFKECLPDILKSIYFYENYLNFDIFILSEKKDGYSAKNEQEIRAMCNGRIQIFEYVENLDMKKEDIYYHKYISSVQHYQAKYNNKIMNNHFVTRMWYRRYILNKMRKKYEINVGNNFKYDWVIRTRFDICYRIDKDIKIDYLNYLPLDNTIYFIPDIISLGSPKVMDIEALLIKQFPYIYNVFMATKKYPSSFINSDNEELNTKLIEKWLFMSEMNLIVYLIDMNINIVNLNNILKIHRY